jgi:hypothetical protein
MVIKFTYLIQFPFGYQCSRDAPFMFYQEFVKKLKSLTCINIDQKCEYCALKDACIYYYLTGQNFSFYPGFLVKRDFVQKRVYDSNEKIQIVFYIFKGLQKYEGYLTGFFETKNMIKDNLYQILDFKKEILELPDLISDKIKIVNPISGIECIKEQISYYNQYYDANFHENIDIKPIQTLKMIDQNRYQIQNYRFQFSGEVGIYEVHYWNSILLEVGVGKTNFLGGGVGIENPD